MIYITLITVGSLKEDYLKEAISEYKKRLSKYATLNEINVKESPIKNEDDAGEIKKALDNEAERIISAMPEDSYKIALCIEGREFSSEELAREIESTASASGKISLVIGSSYGLSDKVKSKCKLKLSLSRLTFPHQLFRVILLEALYRSFTILNGKRYHK